jgi:hypothetical protein
MAHSSAFAAHGLFNEKLPSKETGGVGLFE